MVWRMEDGGVVDSYFHSSKENIRSDPSLYVDHNLLEILVTHVAIPEYSFSKIVLSISLKQ